MRTLAFLCLLAAPALAQAPLTLPNRDVTVVYRADGAARDAIPGGATGPIRVAWSAERQAMRVSSEGRAQALLVDLPAARVRVIDPGLRSAIALPVRAADLDPLRLREVQLTRRGRAVIAGRACTDYTAQSRRGRGTVCLTDDGLALRADGVVDGKAGGFTAISVLDGPVPAAAFEVPRDYMRLALPVFR